MLDLTGAAIGPITSAATSGTIGTALYTAGDCAAAGLLAGAVDPGDTRLDLTVTDARATAVGAGVDGVTNSGLWITWTGVGAGTAVAGNYAAGFNLTLGGQTYPVTVNYAVSNVLAVASSGLSFNKDAYALGELVTARVTLRDAGGRIVPDGLGWANALYGTRTSATARIGDAPPPPAPTMLIEGTRGAGSDANRVFVEGTSTGLVGQVVTPFFRFPGQTGFTAGVGLRTVDADGNFNGQRQTGKRIAMQFRYDGTRSNTIIIAAR